MAGQLHPALSLLASPCSWIWENAGCLASEPAFAEAVDLVGLLQRAWPLMLLGVQVAEHHDLLRWAARHLPGHLPDRCLEPALGTMLQLAAQAV